MTQISGGDKKSLAFEIVSARISDESEQKKYVIYTLQVRHISGNVDLSPSVIERRYTQFLNLYNGLKKEEPQLMQNVIFPKKVLMGNFDNELISTRSTEFESFMKYILSESKLRTSKSLASFLEDAEMTLVKQYLDERNYEEALPLLENIFKLLNKVFTDRSTVVLLALCRLLGCCVKIPGMPCAEKWADLALHRFEGVSDIDLLGLYVPLLNTCMKVWEKLDRDKSNLDSRLQDLLKLGVNIKNSKTLLDEVTLIEKNLFNGP